jgi:hypothetical protein
LLAGPVVAAAGASTVVLGGDAAVGVTPDVVDAIAGFVARGVEAAARRR